LQKEKGILFQKENSFGSVLLQKPLFKEKEFSQLVSKLALQNFGCVKMFSTDLEICFPKNP
jgi:hypothetical protein